MKYYFAFTNGDPMPIYTSESATIEELRKQFVGTWVQTGDEDHDFDRVSDIWTEEQVEKYYE